LTTFETKAADEDTRRFIFEKEKLGNPYRIKRAAFLFVLIFCERLKSSESYRQAGFEKSLQTRRTRSD